MKVHLYEATSADVPAGHRFTARIWCEFTGKKNKPTMDWHPVLFHGADGEALKARVETWWADEVAAAKAKVENAAKAAQARASAKANPAKLGGPVGSAATTIGHA